MFEIRTVHDDEYEALARAISLGFGSGWDESLTAMWRRPLEQDRTIAVLEDGQIVGGASAYTQTMTVPGGELPTASLDNVSVQPTHRRMGGLAGMMERLLSDMHERGEPLSSLSASETTIYGRYGYGIGTLAENWSIEQRHPAFRRPVEYPGRLRFLTKEEAREAIPGIVERACSSRPGYTGTNDGLWDWIFADPESWRRGASAMLYVVYEEDGRGDGYVAYRLKDRKVVVNKLISATDDAHAALWGYCFGVDLVTGVEAGARPVDDPLPWMLADPRVLKRSVHDQMWLRLVDVRAALAGRRYSEEGRLVFDVKDESCPWNQGRLELEGGADGAQCKASDASPDLGLRSSTLSTAYLGAVPMSTLARAGMVEEYTAGALARADRMFSTSVRPWWPISI